MINDSITSRLICRFAIVAGCNIKSIATHREGSDKGCRSFVEVANACKTLDVR